MSKVIVAQNQTRSEASAENQRLLEQGYAQLAAENSERLRYATFRLEDGVTFVNVAISDDKDNPLLQLATFAEFQCGIGERAVEPPAVMGATLVGSYRFFAD